MSKQHLQTSQPTKLHTQPHPCKLKQMLLRHGPMLKTIRSLRAPPSRRYLHSSPACLQLSPSDKIWIAASDIEPTSRDYSRDLRLVRPPKSPSARALPQIARKVVDSNPDIGIPHAVQKIAERAGYGWGKCEDCSKGESPSTRARVVFAPGHAGPRIFRAPFLLPLANSPFRGPGFFGAPSGAHFC